MPLGEHYTTTNDRGYNLIETSINTTTDAEGIPEVSKALNFYRYYSYIPDRYSIASKTMNRTDSMSYSIFLLDNNLNYFNFRTVRYDEY